MNDEGAVKELADKILALPRDKMVWLLDGLVLHDVVSMLQKGSICYRVKDSKREVPLRENITSSMGYSGMKDFFDKEKKQVFGENEPWVLVGPNVIDYGLEGCDDSIFLNFPFTFACDREIYVISYITGASFDSIKALENA